MTRLEVRNLPPGEIVDYLVAALGGIVRDGSVTGEDWYVNFVRAEPATVGRFRVPVLYIDVSGPREHDIAALLRRRTMRGGG